MGKVAHARARISADTIIIAISSAFLLYAGYTRFFPSRVLGGWGELPPALSDTTAAEFKLVRFSGDTVSLPRPTRATLIIANTTTCPYCERSIDAWRVIAKKACDIDLVLVSPEPIAVLKEYWASRTLAGCAQVFIGQAVDPQQLLQDYDVTGTPMHYFVDEAGVLRHVWRGLAEGYSARRKLLAGLEKKST